MINPFERLKAALTSPPSSSSEIATRLAEAERIVSEAGQRVADLQSWRADTLTASAADRSARRRKLTEAQDEAADAQLFAEQLRAMLTAAKVREAETAKKERYETARKKATSAAQSLRTKYPRICAGLVDLIREIAEADRAVEAANADLPEGAERLVGPEQSERDIAARPRTVIEERRVRLWCRPGAGLPLPEELQGKVHSIRDDQGMYGQVAASRVVLREFVRRELLRAVHIKAAAVWQS